MKKGIAIVCLSVWVDMFRSVVLLLSLQYSLIMNSLPLTFSYQIIYLKTDCMTH